MGTSFQATHAASTNRITLIGSLVPTYDANGNLTNDTIHAYTWDAEGKMLNVDSGTANGACVTYDALGRMAEKATGTSCTSTYTEVVYSPSGIRLATMTGQTLQQASVPLLNGAEAVQRPPQKQVFNEVRAHGPIPHPQRSLPRVSMAACMTAALIGHTLSSDDLAGVTTAINLAVVAKFASQRAAVLLPGPGWLYAGVAIAWDAGIVGVSYLECKE